MDSVGDAGGDSQSDLASKWAVNFKNFSFDTIR